MSAHDGIKRLAKNETNVAPHTTCTFRVPDEYPGLVEALRRPEAVLSGMIV